MRIERVSVEAFGGIRGLDTGPEPLPPLVVVLGRNESGKSTLARFLTTMLYGFYPAARSRNPFTPWEGDVEAAGSVELRLEGGGCARVERRLRTSPSARLRSGGREEELRNRALPWVEHVPMRVFEQVFAIDLPELSRMDERTWTLVQDRLIGGLGAEDIASARSVAAELEQEAGSLWRPSRRGNQSLRDLRERRRAVRERRRDAVARDRELRDLVAGREEMAERLARTRAERQEARAAVERVQLLAPLRTRLRRIEELEREAGPAELRSGLPREPDARLRELEERLDELRARLHELEGEIEERAARTAAYDEGARRVRSESAAVEGFLARARASSAARARRETVAREVRDLERRLQSLGARLLERHWTEEDTAAVTTVPVTRLREAKRALDRAREEVRRARAAPPPDGARARALVVLLVGAGGLAGVVGALVGAGEVAAAGGAVALVGLLLPLALRERGPAGPEPMGEEEAERAEERARTSVRADLMGLPVRAELLDEPGEGVVSLIERIRDLLGDLAPRRDVVGDADRELRELDRDGRTLAARLALDAGLTGTGLAAELERARDRADRLAERAADAERGAERLEAERLRVEKALGGVSEELAALREALARLGAGDADRGLAEAARRLEAAARAERLRDELERAHPDLDRLRERIEAEERRGAPWIVDEDESAARRSRLESLDEEIERLGRDLEARDHEIARLEAMETLDQVDGERERLAEEETRLELRRDRLWVLSRLVRQAERRFRDEHQPDVLRRAAEHLAHLTGGRYDRLLVDDQDGSARFLVGGPAVQEDVPLDPPLSTGTREQAWLALRLAVVDHLDQGHERLPVFLDEPLVNWDAARRARAVQALASLSGHRQIFFFTCHPAHAQALVERGGRRIELG